MERIFHSQQARALVLCQSCDGNAGPAGHHGRDVVRVDGPVLGVVLAALIPLCLHLVAVVLFNVPQLRSGLIVLVFNGGFLVPGQNRQLLL